MNFDGEKIDLIRYGVTDKQRRLAQERRARLEGTKCFDFWHNGILTRVFYRTDLQLRRLKGKYNLPQ